MDMHTAEFAVMRLQLSLYAALPSDWIVPLFIHGEWGVSIHACFLGTCIPGNYSNYMYTQWV
jgi:hypothetical protein